jgi:hypothetical protein
MSQNRLLALVAAVALGAGALGAAAVLVLGGDDGDERIPSAATRATDTRMITPERAADDLLGGMAEQMSGSSYGANSATCEKADASGRRFKCLAFVQRGIQAGVDVPLPDNGIGASYGISPGQGAEGVDILATYSDDDASISWSPGGGSALVADLRKRRQAATERRSDLRGPDPKDTPVDDDEPIPPADTSAGGGLNNPAPKSLDENPSASDGKRCINAFNDDAGATRAAAADLRALPGEAFAWIEYLDESANTCRVVVGSEDTAIYYNETPNGFRRGREGPVQDLYGDRPGLAFSPDVTPRVDGTITPAKPEGA